MSRYNCSVRTAWTSNGVPTDNCSNEIFCNEPEVYRAIDNVPQFGHYCQKHYDQLDEETKKHCILVKEIWEFINGKIT